MVAIYILTFQFSNFPSSLLRQSRRAFRCYPSRAMQWSPDTSRHFAVTVRLIICNDEIINYVAHYTVQFC